MEQARRRRKQGTRTPGEVEEIHRTLLTLYDDLTEPAAWTALIVEAACGVLDEQPGAVDPDTCNGMCFASVWLKKRNREHSSTLKTLCQQLHAIRTGRGKD